MRKIVYKRKDGGISIVNPVINTLPKKEKITEEEAELRAWRALPKDAIDPQFVDDIPEDRGSRNAWEIKDGKIIVSK